MRLNPRCDWEATLAKLRALLRSAKAQESPFAAPGFGTAPLGGVAAECADLAEALLEQQQELHGGNQSLLAELSRLDSELESIEGGRAFRLLRAAGVLAASWKAKTGQLLLHSPLHPFYAHMFGSAQISNPYVEWLAAHRAGDPLRVRPPSESDDLLFSVVVPTRNAQLEWLREAIDSVLQQSYTRWQLCVALDGPQSTEVENYLSTLNSSEARITLVRGDQLGISGALNLGLEAAVGAYVAFLDHDDRLEPSALAHVHTEIVRQPAEIFYSDEGYISSAGQPEQPNFKPGWSPQLLLSSMYMGHLLVVSSRALKASGGFRGEHDGAQDYDLVLRLTDGGARVRHIPRVLYHWRRHHDSTAHSAAAKPWTHDAGRAALAGSVARRGWTTTRVEDGPSANTYRLVTAPEAGLQADVIVPTRNATLLERCLSALERSLDTVRPTLLVAHHVTDSLEDDRIRDVAQRHSATLVAYTGDFDYAAINNRAAAQAHGGVLVFLNDDVEAQTRGWLDLLCGALARDRVGIAGARLLYPSGTLQHAGIAVGMADGTGHPGRHRLGSTYWPWIAHTRDVSAVTGACLAIRADLFARLGGFDRSFPVNYNDVDLCLRARQAGYQVIVEASAVLTHREGSTRRGGTRLDERMQFYRRWGLLVSTVDPFFTPHLRHDIEDLSLGR